MTEMGGDLQNVVSEAFTNVSFPRGSQSFVEPHRHKQQFSTWLQNWRTKTCLQNQIQRPQISTDVRTRGSRWIKLQQEQRQICNNLFCQLVCSVDTRHRQPERNIYIELRFQRPKKQVKCEETAHLIGVSRISETLIRDSLLTWLTLTTSPTRQP